MEKILTFIINNNKKILLLLGSDKDPQFHESFWYVVTGKKEKSDLTLEDTVIREVKEETNLGLEKIINLDWILEYESLGNKITEHVFVSYTLDSDIILNEGSIGYKWCSLDEFIELIKWYDDKNKLKEILSKYMEA